MLQIIFIYKKMLFLSSMKKMISEGSCDTEWSN